MSEVFVNSPRHQIGTILRVVREKTGRQQGQVASGAGISASMLSQIERGQVSPSIDTLFLLCEELGLSPGDLFNRIAHKKAVHIHHAGERLRTSQQGIQYEQLVTSTNAHYPGELVLIEVAPGVQTGVRGQGHEGIEMGYVLGGQARLLVDDQEYALVEGDSVSFSSHLPHRLSNTGECPFRALWSVSPPHQNYVDLEG